MDLIEKVTSIAKGKPRRLVDVAPFAAAEAKLQELAGLKSAAAKRVEELTSQLRVATGGNMPQSARAGVRPFLNPEPERGSESPRDPEIEVEALRLLAAGSDQAEHIERISAELSDQRRRLAATTRAHELQTATVAREREAAIRIVRATFDAELRRAAVKIEKAAGTLAAANQEAFDITRECELETVADLGSIECAKVGMAKDRFSSLDEWRSEQRSLGNLPDSR